jgi:hypothetical protein
MTSPKGCQTYLPFTFYSTFASLLGISSLPCFVALDQWPPLLAAREVARFAKVAARDPMVMLEGDSLEVEVSKGLRARFEALVKT